MAEHAERYHKSEKCGTTGELLACLFCQVKLPSSITAKQYINHIQVDLWPIVLTTTSSLRCSTTLEPTPRLVEPCRTWTRADRLTQDWRESVWNRLLLLKLLLLVWGKRFTCTPWWTVRVHLSQGIIVCSSRRLFPNRSSLSKVTWSRGRGYGWEWYHRGQRRFGGSWGISEGNYNGGKEAWT